MGSEGNRGWRMEDREWRREDGETENGWILNRYFFGRLFADSFHRHCAGQNEDGIKLGQRAA
jgi:hypothetical protein